MNTGKTLKDNAPFEFEAKIIIEATRPNISFSYKEVEGFKSIEMRRSLTEELHSPSHLASILKDVTLSSEEANIVFHSNIAHIGDSKDGLNFSALNLTVPVRVTMEYTPKTDVLKQHPSYLTLARAYDALPEFDKFPVKCNKSGKFTVSISAPDDSQDMSGVPVGSMFNLEYGLMESFFINETDERCFLVHRTTNALANIFTESFKYAINYKDKNIAKTAETIEYVYSEMKRAITEIGTALLEEDVENKIVFKSPLFVVVLKK